VKKHQGHFGFAEREAVEKVAHNAILAVGAKVVEGVYRHTPMENGHAHTAWQAAVEDVPDLEKRSKNALSAAGKSQSDLSHDEKAVAAGSGSAELAGLNPSITLKNKLGFVSIMEHGGVIEPIGPGGRKTHGIKGPGPLFGERASAPPQGMVMIRSGGSWRFFKRIDYPALNPVGKAVEDAREWFQAKVKRQST
jgi:hypothetical protein